MCLLGEGNDFPASEKVLQNIQFPCGQCITGESKKQSAGQSIAKLSFSHISLCSEVCLCIGQTLWALQEKWCSV